MTDRSYVEKAADAGAGKISLLQEDPLRYMLRSVGAGMGLTLGRVRVLGIEAKPSRHFLGRGDRIRFFWRRPDDYRVHEY